MASAAKLMSKLPQAVFLHFAILLSWLNSALQLVKRKERYFFFTMVNVTDAVQIAIAILIE